MDAINPIGAYAREANNSSTVTDYASPVVKNTAVSSSKSAGSASSGDSDNVNFSQVALEVSYYSNLAKQMSDKSDLGRLEALKQTVAHGTYPAPLLVDGFIAMMGGSLGGENPKVTLTKP